MTTTIPTTFVDVHIAREQILPATPEALAWLAEQGWKPETDEGSYIAIRWDKAYIAPEGQPIRLGLNVPRHPVTALPEHLAARADKWIVAAAEVGDQHWGATHRMDSDEREDKVRDRLAARISVNIIGKLSPACSGANCTRQARNATQDGRAFCGHCSAEQQSEHPDIWSMPLFAFTVVDEEL